MTDQSMIDTEALRKANEELIAQKMEEMKQDMAARITGESTGGRYGKTGPGSWDKLQDDTVEIAVKKAKDETKAEVLGEIEKREKARADAMNAEAARTDEENRKEWSRMSEEWKEAVSDGLMPDISPEVKAKLKANPDYNSLTEEEQQDPGLVAYNQARALHIQLRREGKSNSFYRTVGKFLNRMPSGAAAPVLGGSAAIPQKSQDYSYDEVAANRKRKFRF